MQYPSYFSAGKCILARKFKMKLAVQIFINSFIFFGSIYGFDLSRYDHNPFYGWGDYTRFSKFIENKKIKTVFEIGSRDGCDALNLSEYFKCRVFAFECNPTAIQKCMKNCSENPNVVVVPVACWHENSEIPFYPVVFSGDGRPVNIGASSCLKVLQDGPYASDVQADPILVRAVRLDTWLESNGVDAPDLICIDAQGATLNILVGLGKRLREVSYVIAEIGHVKGWENENLDQEIYKFMNAQGFRRRAIDSCGPFGDALFVNVRRARII